MFKKKRDSELAGLLSTVTHSESHSESSSDSSADPSPMRAQPAKGYHTLLETKETRFSDNVNLDHMSERSSETELPIMGVDNQITLAWQNVAVKSFPRGGGDGGCCWWRRRQARGQGAVKSRSKTRQILKGVTGFARPGTLLVIMGASGAGKTTLLNVLTRRNLARLEVTGDVYVNGRQIGDAIARISSYVQQDDLFVGTLTVQEHLNFHAALKMDQNLTQAERDHVVNQVLQELGLSKCRDTTIGVRGRVKGLSGGEMKRLAFAAAILTRPSLLFCDEPTSGLDSFTAQNVVQALKDMAQRGRTVICTIHQPSSQVYAMFDKLLLLAEGRVAYMGPTADADAYFSGFGLTCPTSFNPADFYIQALAVAPGREEQCRQNVKVICDHYEQSDVCDKINFLAECFGNTDPFIETLDAVGPQRKFKANWLTQLGWCTWRSWADMLRNAKMLPARIVQQLVIGLVMGLIFWRQDYDRYGLRNIDGAMFMATLNIVIGTSIVVAVGFTRHVPLFRREYQDRLYSTTAFYFSKIISDTPGYLSSTFVFATVVYLMIGLRLSLNAYCVFMAATLVLGITATAIGHAMGAVFPYPEMTSLILSMVLSIFIFFSGYLRNESPLLAFLWPVKLMSPFAYSYDILVINQWRPWICSGTCRNSTICEGNGPGKCYDLMEAVNELKLDPGDLELDFLSLIVMTLVLQIFGILSLRRNGGQK